MVLFFCWGDKYRMLYIEEELKQRRKAAIEAGADEFAEPILTGAEAVASLDPRDELYKIAEKYRIDKKPVVEGNVTLSATMLTSIPEVDLGIESVVLLSLSLLLPLLSSVSSFCVLNCLT